MSRRLCANRQKGLAGGSLAMRIADELISEIRNRVSIVKIIGDYVTLRRSGRNWVGLCPFHNEKTPSFSVNDERQTFHCFGCHEGGDVFAFLMKVQGRRFPDVARELADQVGIQLETDSRPAEVSFREHCFRVNGLAQAFFAQQLRQSPHAQAARAYLDERGISADSVERFGLGFGGGNWDDFLNHCRPQAGVLQIAMELGLVVQNTGRPYDRFRRRVIFPIHDVGGKILGFGGRVLGDEKPKYLNSPESELYHKQDVLFARHLAQIAARREDRIIVVEGYMDAIMLHQHALSNVVATCGTALSQRHLNVLQGYTKNIVLLFDGDTAGLRAIERLVPLFAASDLLPRVVVLPAGEDPDSFVKKEGSDRLRSMLERAQPMFEFLIDRHLQRHDATTVGKIDMVRKLVPMLRRFPRVLDREIYLGYLAEKGGIDIRALRAELTIDYQHSTPHSGSAPPVGNGIRSTIQLEKFPVVETHLLELALVEPKLALGLGVLIDYFSEPLLKIVATSMLDFFKKSPNANVAELVGRAGLGEPKADGGTPAEQVRSVISALLIKSTRWEALDVEKAFMDCRKQLLLGALRRTQLELTRELGGLVAEQAENNLKDRLVTIRALMEQRRDLQTN